MSNLRPHQMSNLILLMEYKRLLKNKSNTYKFDDIRFLEIKKALEERTKQKYKDQLMVI